MVNSCKGIKLGPIFQKKDLFSGHGAKKHHTCGHYIEMNIKGKSLEVQLVFQMGILQTIKIKLLPTFWSIKPPQRREMSEGSVSLPQWLWQHSKLIFRKTIPPKWKQNYREDKAHTCFKGSDQMQTNKIETTNKKKFGSGTPPERPSLTLFLESSPHLWLGWHQDVTLEQYWTKEWVIPEEMSEVPQSEAHAQQVL